MPHPLQRQPFPPAVQRPPNTDPNALFEQPQPAFCAFPDDGPNIFQQALSSVSAALVRWLRDVPSVLGAFVAGPGNLDTDVLTEALRENSWSIIIGLVIVVVLCVLAWFFSPKGENQTYVRPVISLPRPLLSLRDRTVFKLQKRPAIYLRLCANEFSCFIASGGVH
jgi:V-type H+-transporting ATPase subunit e